MRPLRVGLVAESYFPSLGGIQEHVRHLRNVLRQQGVDVTILTGRQPSSDTPVPEDAERGVIRVGRARSFRTGGTFTQATIGPLAAYNFYRALRKGQFDLLNIHGPCDFGLAFWGLSMFRGPKVLTLHNACFPDAPWRHRVATYYRWVFRRAAAVIAVSEATAQTMGRYADFQATIIPNGIDVAYWRACSTPRYLQPGKRNLVYLGRLEERNGPEVAIDAFCRIATEQRRPMTVHPLETEPAKNRSRRTAPQTGIETLWLQRPNYEHALPAWRPESLVHLLRIWRF